MSDWIDPDEPPELTEEFFKYGEVRVGGKLVRKATGYLGPDGYRPGRPPKRARAKDQITLRLDPDIIERFRADGPGWQSRINDALRKAVGLPD